MPYGTIKVDNITFTNGGSDSTITVSGIVESISGNITATGTIQGATIIGTSTVSGATVTGNTGQFTTLTGGAAGFTTVTGVSGIFTSQISGATVTGSTASFTSGTFVSGIFTTQISGATITGNTGNFTTFNAGTANLTSGVFASGTQGAPSLSIGTTTNGLYSPGADQVAISTGGSGRLFVDANGRVGINSAPSLWLLEVKQDSASSAGGAYPVIQVNNPNANGYAGVYLNDSTAQAGLETQRNTGHLGLQAGGAERLRITSTGTVNIVGAGSAGSTQAVSFNGSAPVNSLVLTSGGLLGVGTSTIRGTSLLDARGDISFGSNANYYGLLSYNAGTGHFESTSSDGGFKWIRASGPATSMTLDSSGRLGIGTSSPATPVDCRTSGRPGYLLVTSDTGTSNQYAFSNGSNFHAGVLGTVTGNTTNSGDVFGLGYAASVVNDDFTPVLTWTANTNRVGIGTTSPGAELDVIGGANVGDGTTTVRTVASSGVGFIGTSTNHPLAFRINNGETARIDTSGRLLVGTSSALTGATAQYSKNVNLGNSANATGNAVLAIGRGAAATSISSGNTIGSIYFTDNGAGEFASIDCFADAAPGTNDYPGRLVFSTTEDGASSPTERMRITNGGEILFGTSTTTNGCKLALVNTNATRKWGFGTIGTSTYFAVVDDATGAGVQLNAGSTSWSTFSDERLKDNLIPIQDGLGKVSRLRAVTGRYKTDDTGMSRSFLIAQDVQAVLPEAVDVMSDDMGTLSLKYTEVIPLLVSALKESKERIETLEAKVAALEGA